MITFYREGAELVRYSGFKSVEVRVRVGPALVPAGAWSQALAESPVTVRNSLLFGVH